MLESLPMVDPRLCIHHVGGRAGTQPFPALSHFAPDLVNVLYEADTSCVAQIEEHFRASSGEVHVIPSCLADGPGTRTLYLNYDAYSSSLLPINPDYDDFYIECRQPDPHDYPWGDSTRPMRELQVETRALDDVLTEEPHVPPPDFLSIDTQGAELQILEGAKQTLREHTLAIVLEVEFHPIYQDQPLFGDICSWLTARGYHFVKLLHTPEMYPHRGPLGLRGEGFLVYSDALFLRRLDCLPPDETRHRDLLDKLAFLALVLNQTEYALAALEARRACGPILSSGFVLLKGRYLTRLDIP